MMTLVEPSLERLDEYAAALRRGWSPNNLRDFSGEQLAEIAADPAAFVRGLVRQTGTIRLGDGREVPKLPGALRWMWDDGFCGGIGFRYQPGTEELPPETHGHIGYAVVPWKRRRGYATEALRQTLPYAAAAGLRHVDLTCDADNRPSQKVIEANGGVEVARFADDAHHGSELLLYRIVLAGRPAA